MMLPVCDMGDHTAAVIDYIVRRHETGGYVALDAQDSPHVLFGNNNFMVKINHKKVRIRFEL